MILALLAIVITLILVVGIHEAGHAFAAQRLGVKIRRIAIGLGKPLLTFKNKSGCEWVWALWPIGGYVKLLNSRIESVPEQDHSLCFDKKSIGARCVILASGALANLFTAWLALTIMFTIGYQQHKPFIQTVIPQSIAASAGLKANDRLVEIDGWKTNSWQEVGMGLIMALGKGHVSIWVSNAEETLHKVTLDLSQWQYKKQDSSLLDALGIKAAPINLHTQHAAGLPLGVSAYYALEQLVHLFIFFMLVLKQLVLGMLPLSVLLGPLGLLANSVSAFFQGIAPFLFFIASLSFVVAFVNLLPLPGLDGGSMAYLLIEKWRGKAMSIAMEVLLYRLTTIVFAVLLVQLILNDFQHYLHKIIID